VGREYPEAGGSMESKGNIPKTINEYIMTCPKEIRGVLREIKATIKAAAPEAEERISYRMPAFWQKGPLVYFAPFKDHIGFFPTASGVKAFKKELAGFKTSKGTVQLPLDKPVPLALIRKIVKYKVAENMKRDKDKLKLPD
jgi:uncharacterized protein YdhG (YjbR/CyaY superfamily)